MPDSCRVYKFTASTGNRCVARAYRLESLHPIVDMTWNAFPSNTEIEECNEWFAAIVQSFHPGMDGEISSIVMENEDDRQALLNAHLNRPKAGGSPCNN